MQAKKCPQRHFFSNVSLYPLFNSAYGEERVAVGAGLLHKDSFAVEGVDAHMAGGVHYLAVAHADADVYDAPLGVLEEGEVVALHVTQAHFVAAGGLLAGVAGEPDAVGFEAYLRQAAAVDAAGGTAAPKVWGAEEESLGQRGGVLEGCVLFVVHPALVAVIVTLDEAPFLLTVKHIYGVAQHQLVDHLAAVACFGPHRHRTQKTISLHLT